MKKFFLATSLITASFLVLFATYASAAEKIGTINIREIVSGSDAGKTMEAEFKKSVNEKRVAIQKKGDDLKKKKEALEKQRSMMTPEALQEKELNFQVESRDYERMVKDANDELRAKEQVLQSKLIPEIIKAARTVGEKEKYTLILEESAIVYSAKENSLTTKVITELNKTYTGK
jgi:outer membrane protein